MDLVLTDPPYNVGKDFGNNTDKWTDNHTFFNWLEYRLKLLHNLTNHNANIVVFCSHLFVPDISIRLRDYWHYRRMMIWHYKNGLSRQTDSPVTEYEPILWFSGSDTEWTYNLEDVRIPYRSERVKNPVYKTNKRGEKVAWTPNPNGAKRGDVWEYPCLAGKLYEDERTEHPTQKPESLIIDLVKAFCPKKDGIYSGLILDPFCGSGTVPVCCERLNKLGHDIKWVGIELEKKWVDTANQRLQRVAELPKMIL